MTTHFLIVQHAEKERTEGNPPLTAHGKEQAIQIATHLARQPITHVYSSPLRRVRETAQPIADALGLPLQIDTRLRERMNWGDSDTPQTFAAFLAEWKRADANRDFAPTSGDSSRVAGARFQALLDALARTHEGTMVALVTSGGVTIDLLRTLFGDAYLHHSLPDVIEHGVPPASITHLTHDATGYALVAFGSVAHLRR